MPIPEAIKEFVDLELVDFCDRRFPAHVRHRVWASHKWRGNTVTIFEWRSLFDRPTEFVDIKVAQFRYDSARRWWSLFCSDRNGKWWIYDDKPGAARFSDLLDEVSADPTGIFWG